ncbi:MAG: ABC transporter ATP-binding protein [Evtepia sp.]|uniref:ABC transporter ATP-binding protein n=1 Tax=Evtepia sp. TaxID=2773933 RepID=UPI002A759CF2|nr:ABC transporter ATP-binding protein [Evtepia sp.]MDY3014153.1 ABC transporter ATP-binding protein [Evtepia sp.]
MNVIEVSHLTRDYGKGRGVFDLTFSVGQGEVFGFLGPNGAGKTTTIRHLMGFLRPQAGRCSMNGKDCWQDSAAIQRDLGYIPGELAFFEEMTGGEFLKFLERYRGPGSGVRKEELLARFALDTRGKIKRMSKGMKQKLGIVAAFMHDPTVLILDEPTSGLDPLMQNAFISIIHEERERGKTILLSSHMFEEVERTCQRVGIIRQGRLVALETIQALREKHMRAYQVTLPDPETAEAFARDFQGSRSVENPCQVEVRAMQTLQERFLDYYGGEVE